MVGTTRKRAKIIVDDYNGTFTVDCTEPGYSCRVSVSSAPQFDAERREVINYFVSSESHAMKQDPKLRELTDKLNGLMQEIHSARTDKQQTLGLLETPRGLMLVWKYESEGASPAGRSGMTTYDVDDMTPEEIEKLLWSS
ncbi:hypothetical protein GCM10008171_03950 [Methylopila jiangsuensis]|uniref:Uncharacterized protein n=1 Tax=Methylopila jiangsuensis TaxID=586230 RepID=A0A9W6JEV6_9HYPH|nr:hypothetical protein [Methylopila jiangsuensis]MDR6285384.1 hypothetical protein [Methylopila jiangsuensis]GLK75141.1 hypothetical protein GCM10008171_03950 [Methylopila jiangsuensis]